MMTHWTSTIGNWPLSPTIDSSTITIWIHGETVLATWTFQLECRRRRWLSWVNFELNFDNLRCVFLNLRRLLFARSQLTSKLMSVVCCFVCASDCGNLSFPSFIYRSPCGLLQMRAFLLFFFSSFFWRLLLRLVIFSLFVPLIDCWCSALIKFDHVSFCIEIWLILSSFLLRSLFLVASELIVSIDLFALMNRTFSLKIYIFNNEQHFSSSSASSCSQLPVYSRNKTYINVFLLLLKAPLNYLSSWTFFFAMFCWRSESGERWEKFFR